MSRLPIYVPKTSGIISVGYTRRTDSLPISRDASWQEEPIVREAFDRLKVRFDDKAYGVSMPSMTNVLRTVEDRYDFDSFLPDMPVLERLRQEVFPAIAEQYSDLWGRCRVVPFDEIRFVAGTSPGPVFKWAGCADKLEAVRKFRSYLEWYVEGGFLSSEPPLWKQNGKTELLKAAKLVDGQRGIRGFTCPPIDEFLLQGKWCQDFNEKMDVLGEDVLSHFWPSIGINLRDGAWFTLMDRLDRTTLGGGQIIEGDVVRYDSCEWKYLLEEQRKIRLKCVDPRTVTTVDASLALRRIYDVNYQTFMLLPNGQVVQKQELMPSGSIITSNDGCGVHWEALGWHWVRMTDRPIAQMFDHMTGKIYCDDHILAVDSEFAHLADFKERSRSYSDLGLELDQEKDFVSSTTEGHNYLGFRNANGNPVPYREDKFYSGMLRPDGPRDVNIGLQRAASSMDNACFSDQMFSVAKNVARCYIREGAVWRPSDENPWVSLPHQHTLKRRWYGLENEQQQS